MAISVGSVEVDVVPNTQGVYARLRAGLVPAATRAGEDAGKAAGRSFGPAMQGEVGNIGTSIGQQIGQQVAARIVSEVRDALRDGVQQGGAAATPAATQQGNRAGGAFARSARARIEAAFRSIPDVTIGADTSEADSDLQALRARMQALSSRTIGVDLDAGEALAELSALENELRRVGASHPNPTVRADTASARAELSALRLQMEQMEADPTRIRVETDGTFGQRLRAQVQAAEASLPNINIGASTSAAEAEIASLRARLTSLRDVRIGVDMDAATARAQITDVHARLTALSASDVDIAVRVDAGAAATQLAAVQGMVSALDGQTARIDVDTSGAMSAIFQLGVAIGGVAAIPAIPVLAAGLGSITAAATAAGAGVGAFGAAAIPALKDITGALQAQKAAQQAATTATGQGGQTAAQAARQSMQQAGAQQALATAHRNAARQIGQAQQAVRDAEVNGARQIGQARQAVTEAHRTGARQIAAAEQAVGDAVRTAARANEQAAEQVKSARQGLSSAYEQAADRMRSANERVISAEQSLADAQRTARQAQQDLTQARRDAKAELQDLTNRLASAQLSERDAALSVQEAQTRLRAVQAKGSKASLLEQQRAQLAYDQAVQRLREQRLETGRLGAEKRASDKSGVDGTDRVKSAQERLVAAQRGVASQEAALSKARSDMGRAQIQNSRDIAAAQLRVAQAQRTVARTQEDGARSIARARAAVGVAEQQAAASVAKAKQQLAVAEQTSAANIRRAQQQVATARQSAADSIASAERQVRSAQLSSAGGANAASAAQAKYQAALAKMTPAARGTFNAFLRLRTAFTGWSRSLQPAIMPIFTRALNGMRRSLNGITPFVYAAARGITTLQDRVSRGFKSPWWKSFKKDLAGSVEPAIVGLGISFGRLFKGMAGIVQAFLPHMDGISRTMQRITGRFANWATGLKGSPEFERFLSYSAEMGPHLARTLGDIASAFYQISRALSPLSGPVLEVIGFLARGLADVARTVPELVQALWGLYVITRLMTLAIALMNLVMNANPVVRLITFIILLVGAVIYAYRKWGWFRTAVQAVWRGIRIAAEFAWKKVLKPAFDGIAWALGYVGRAAMWLWRKVFEPAAHGIGIAIGWVRRHLWVLLGAGPIGWIIYFASMFVRHFGLIRRGVTAAFRGIGRVAVWLWQNALLPAWRGIAWAVSLYWNYWLKPIIAVIVWYFRFLGRVAMWLWTNAIKPAFRGIATAASWVWNNALKPAFSAIWAGLRAVGRAAMWLWNNAIKPAFKGIWLVGKWLAIVIAVLVVGPIVIAFRLLAWAGKWLYRNVLLPAFRGIAAAGRWMWQKVLKPTWAAIKVGIRGLATAFRWLRDKVFAPVMRGIATVGRWIWQKVLRPIWNAMKAGLRLLAAAFRWIWHKVISPVWSGIRWAISNAWTKGIRPAFNAIKRAVSLVATAFRKAKDAIGRAWDGIKEKTRKPVKWVIDKVYNYGVRALWNNAREVLPGLKYLKWQKFATGGPVFGAGTATSDSIPARLSRGEHVWTAKEVQGAGGHGTMQAMRQAAAGGAYAKGGPAVAPSGVPGFAKGGVVDWFKSGAEAVGRGAKTVGGWIGKGVGAVKDAALGGVYKVANLAAKPVRALLDRIPGGKSGWGQMATAAPKGILNAVLSAIKSNEDGAMGGGTPGVARALKWAKTQAGKPYQWGGGGNPSWDCSGFLSGIQKVIQGRNPKGRLWSTHAFSGSQAPKGWKYHKKSPYQIGITNSGKGHTAGTLAGTNVESRGGDGVVIGKRARGWNNGMFGKNWYGFKPAIGSGGFSAKAVGAAQSAAKQMLGEYGWGQDQFGPLKKLWQKESGWRWNARNASSGAYGIPQCVDLETRILTKRGLLRHDQVRVGDETLGWDLEARRSGWTRVSAVHHYEQADMVTIRGDGGWEARCTPGHRWLMAMPNGDTVMVTADRLEPGMRLRLADARFVRVTAVEARGAEDVWCVTTGLGTWTAEQDEDMFLTGNSLPASKMRSAGADWKTNPATQIKWGLKYIKGRYGNPAGAWAHSQRVNWYDGGGYLPEGLSTVYNGTGSPEPVMTSQQMRALQGAAVRGSDGASSAAPGDFTGDLYLDSGEFLGQVRGVVKQEQASMTSRFRAGR